uniref:Uncharacterized protein n=1 Tax=Panagrellus redivivus TaxID=6233 RepID=A0A7E4UXE2_PANRE
MAKCQVALALIAVNLVIMATAFEAATHPPFGIAQAYEQREMSSNDQAINEDILTPYGKGLLRLANRQQAIDKRTPLTVQSRSLKQYKNCYFSPVQCVLLELRRRR